MNRDEKFIALAKRIAKEAPSFGINKHCSIIVRGRKIIGVGVNSKITHPAMLNSYTRDKIFLHSEVDALNAVRYKDIDGTTIYVARHSDAGASMSKPCPICIDKIRKSGINKIVYSTNNGYKKEKVVNT